MHAPSMVHDDDIHNDPSLNSPTSQRRNIRTYREYESIFITATFSEFSSWFHGHPLAIHHPFAHLPSYAERKGSLFCACHAAAVFYTHLKPLKIHMVYISEPLFSLPPPTCIW